MARTEAQVAAQKAASRRFYEKNREKLNARSRAWSKENALRRAFNERRRRLLKEYGLSLEQYDAMLMFQGGVCRICHGPPRCGEDPLVVDHCHVTGKIRGLLCHACNSAIGLMNDDPEIVRRALEYLNVMDPAGCGY